MNRVQRQILGFHSSKNFPSDECINPCSREKGVFEGNKEYLCLILDNRFDDRAQLKIMKPYVYNGFEGYGQAWVDSSGNYTSNLDQPIHPCEDEFVVGFKELV